MSIRCYSVGTYVLLSVFLVISNAPYAHAEYPGDILLKLVIGDIEGKANNIINNAKSAGNEFTAALAKNALDVINAWKIANKELIEETFKKLDDSDQKFFNNLDAALEKISHEREITFANAQQLTVQWATIVGNLPFASKDAELYYYTPRVIAPVGNSVISVSLTGPRLANSNPLLVDDQQRRLALRHSTEFELVANIDRKTLKFADTELSFMNLHLTFVKSSGLLSSENSGRDMQIWLLPKIMAHYSIRTKVNTDETSTFTIDVFGKGKDAPYNILISIPPDLKEQKWKLDTEKLLRNDYQIVDLGGDHGHCTGLRRESLSSESFVFYIDLGHRTVGFTKSDAWQNCRLTIPVKRLKHQAIDGPTFEGDLNWTDDKPINLPPDMTSYTVSLKMFDGRSYIVTDIDHLPYGSLSIIKHDQSLIFRPNPPKDF